jgi:hypothetical protein
VQKGVKPNEYRAQKFGNRDSFDRFLEESMCSVANNLWYDEYVELVLEG